jgi:hypothetical protein
MAQQDFKTMVSDNWHKAFVNFTETGQATPEFLQYLESDPRAKQAVEIAFEQQAQAFEGVAKDLKNAPSRPGGAPVLASAEVSGKILDAVEGALRLPEEQRDKVIQETMAALVTSAQTEQRHALRELVDSLGSSLDKVI